MRVARLSCVGVSLVATVLAVCTLGADKPAADPQREALEVEFRAIGSEFRKLERAVLDRLTEIEKRNQFIRSRNIDFEIREKQVVGEIDRAKLEREIAEIQVKEFTDGTAVQEAESNQAAIQAATKAIALNKEMIKSRQELIDSLEKLPAEKTKLDAIIAVLLYEQKTLMTGNQLSLTAESFALKQAQLKQELFEKYDRRRRLSELRANVEGKRANELMKQANWGMEQDRYNRSRREISTPAVLTDVEKAALQQFQTAMAAWKKFAITRDQVRKEPSIRPESIRPLMTAATDAIRDAQRAWDDAQDRRAEAMDIELSAKLNALGIKPAR